MQQAKKSTESLKRSVLKTVTYRIAIVILDFSVVFLFTHKYDVAAGFVVISNLYTSVGYFVHERIWDRIRWGKDHPDG